MDFNFYMPVKLVCGNDCIRQNSSLLAAFGSRCLIITGKSSAQACGALADVREALKKEHITFTVFNQITANPLLSACFKAGEAAKRANAEFIIAIGGGSVLDAAKAAAIAATNTFRQQEDIYAKHYLSNPLPLVVIGTTAGTGSEVSPTAVITVDSLMEKRSITADVCYPALALCDTKYTYRIPRSITVSTALDAFAHATEAWFSKRRNTTVELYASACLPKIYMILKTLAQGRELSEEQRDTMYYCSLFAGMCLCIGTTFPHLLGYTLTDKRNVPHGQACAVFDKALIAWCAEHAPEQAEAFFEMLHAPKEDIFTTLENLIDIPDTVRFTKEETENYSKSWTDNNPKLQNVFGNFKRENALEIFENLFYQAK